MNYIHDTMSGGYVPKLLGIYERELHPIIARLAELGVQRVLNIGAADGYYAVGLCRVFPDLRVVAFETEPRGREYVRAMAERNGVLPRVEIRGNCDVPSLQAALTDPRGTLVLCDVEGYEDVLMDPEKVPGLRAAWLLVELHDGKIPAFRDASARASSRRTPSKRSARPGAPPRTFRSATPTPAHSRRGIWPLPWTRAAPCAMASHP
jgi:hypothetical protein